MNIWFTAVLTVHVLVALGIIFLVLLQHGKGADMGAAFGSGSSGSLFGASGSANFLSRTTAARAAVFFLTSLGMAYLGAHKPGTGGGGGGTWGGGWMPPMKRSAGQTASDGRYSDRVFIG